ncbi:MAG: hypothetical protein Q4Q58_05100 [Thermoplasmata archaeon]|nr:hypothetical protein [Thermoplasmata archaeon]
MEKDALKKSAVIVIAIVFVAMCVLLPVGYYYAELPLWAVGIIAVVFICMAVATLYYANERLKEIEEGLDDAVDDY